MKDITPKDFVTANEPSNLKLMESIDETTFIYSTKYGFLWYDKFNSCVSDKFFKNAIQARNDYAR